MNIHPRSQSIRWRLPATYAGIALLTAAALGVALLLPLRGYYQERERAYLQRNAAAIAEALSPLMSLETQPIGDLKEHISFLSRFSQTRVRLLDPAEQQVADSGLPNQAKPGFVAFTRIQSQGADVVFGSYPLDVVTAPFLYKSTGEGMVDRGPVVGDARAAGEYSAAAGYPAVLTELPHEASGGAQKAPVVPGKTFSAPADRPPEGIADRLQIFFAPEAGSPVMAVRSGTAEDQAASLVSVIPMAGSMYGFELQGEVERENAPSDQVHRQPVRGLDGEMLGWVELSGGPAYGREIVTNVARGWLVASLVAVILAGSVGWWVSRRMTAPLLALTGVTRRMAEGDLSVRANLPQADEIGSLGRSFNEMAERVEGTVETLRRFVSDAAHELHTPLTALRTNLELAASSGEQSEYLRRAGEQLLRMEDLTIDLLDLSRIETGTLDVMDEPIPLNELLLQTCEPFASQAEQAGVAFSIQLPEEPLVVDGQPGQLQRAVTNLLENALKFTPPGGVVWVGLEASGPEARMWVEDTGIGIAPEDLPLLFNRFHRGRNASGYPGSGLGLSIVRAIAGRHRGRVWVESANGRTRFTLALPLHEPRP